jgi:hypothetical protein
MSTYLSSGQIKLRVPVALAEGHYEKLSNSQLRIHYWDIKHEINRRGLDLEKKEDVTNDEETPSVQ